MAICRWSTDNFESDVYVYEGYDGVEIHVAARRLALDSPLVDLPDLTDPATTPEDWLAAHKLRRAVIDKSSTVPIGGPFDGTSFTEPDDESALARLRELARLGYRIPDCVWTALDEGCVLTRGGLG